MTGRDDKGFTLIEVLVALAVLSIGLTAAFKLQSLDLDLIRAERQTTRACLGAESLMWSWTVRGFASTGSQGGQAAGEVGGIGYKASLKPAQGSPGLMTIILELDDGPGGEPPQEFRRLWMSEKKK